MKFKSYVPYACNAGCAVTVENKSWLCDFPCTLLGVTEKGEPVVSSPTGARLNTFELVPADSIRGKFVPGQTTTERKFLGAYLKVNPKKLKGIRLVEVSYTEDSLILLGENKTYAKLGPSTDCDLDLTMDDLWSLGQVDDEVMAKFKPEQRHRQQEASEWKLRRAILAVGKDRAQAILDVTRS